MKTKVNSILTGLRIQISTDPHNFVNLDPDPHSEKLDSDRIGFGQNSGALEYQNGARKAVDAHIGGVEP